MVIHYSMDMEVRETPLIIQVQRIADEIVKARERIDDYKLKVSLDISTKDDLQMLEEAIKHLKTAVSMLL